MSDKNKKTAGFWTPAGDAADCFLCPRRCRIIPGDSGYCRVRKMTDQGLISLVYGRPAALNIDPVEKKPLYHFLPGHRTFSIGTVGCNLRCKFCQNWELSTNEIAAVQQQSAENLVNAADRSGCESIAFTYNEPTIFAEYVMDISRLAAERQIPSIMVTNGYISPQAREDVYKNIHAANIDLKGFSDAFYRKHTDAKLQPVCDTIEWCVHNGIHTEITTLLIPGLNDSKTMLEKECEWIVNRCGPDVPVHFTAFTPQYEYTHLPPTSLKSLTLAVKIAIKAGCHYIYCGNYPEINQTTYCHKCGEPVILRKGFKIKRIAGRGHEIPIVWSINDIQKFQ